MNSLLKAILSGLLRSAVIGFGTWLTTQKLADSTTVAQISGSLLALGGIGFSVLDKFIVDHKVKTANQLPLGVVR